MNLLKKLKVKQKIFLVMLIPLMALTYYVINDTYHSYKEYSGDKELLKLAHYSKTVSSLVHQLQKERGMTAGYLGSAGKKFSSSLISQKNNTNKKLQELKEILKIHPIDELPSNISMYITNALGILNSINTIRNNVQNLNIDLSTAIQYYTNLNNELLTFIAQLHHMSENNEITSNMIAYSSFLMAKEKAGIERAIGANILVHNKTTIKQKVMFAKLISNQQDFINTFLNTADETMVAYYKSKLSGDNEIEKIENTIINQNNDFKIEASYWFDKMTQKINTLKNIDDFIVNDMENDMQEYENSSLDKLIFDLVFGIIILISVLVLGVLVSTNILNSLKIIEKGLNSFLIFIKKESKDTIEIKLEGDDEFAIMAKNINLEVQRTKDILAKDFEAIEAIDDIMEKVSNGYFSYKITSMGGSQEVKELSSKINIMLEMIRKKLVIVNNVLQNYGKGTFDYKPNHNEQNMMQGDFAVVLSSVMLLGVNISELFAQLSNAGDAMNNNASVLNENASHLAQSSNEQAASLEETAAALEEISAAINNNNEKVTLMTRLTDEVVKSAENGEKMAQETTSSMDTIDTQINAISDAITIIDQISFQTNILSLNAAVEAATAGEAGKGFAVVAQEVRNLASRSAEAANEIKSLVEIATKSANSGKDISSKMISGYEELKEKIITTKDGIQDVLTSSQEQAEGINQINDAVNELDQVTQRNAAASNEIAHLTDDITKLSTNLIQVASSAKFDKKFLKMVCNPELLNITSQRKNSHIVFLNDNFSKLGQISSYQTTTSHDCKLGVWIKDVESKGESFTKHQNWNELKKDHDKIHNLMQELIDQNGQKADNSILNGIGVNINDSVKKVFDALDKLKEDVCG